MWDDTKTKKGSLQFYLSIIISIMGFVTFMIWSIILILLIIGNIIYWRGFPYELGPTSEDILWGGWLHLLIVLFLLIVTPLSLIITCSGALTFIGGLVYFRKKRLLFLMISYFANNIIFLLLSFLICIPLIIFLNTPDRIPFSVFILGLLLISYLIRLILTTIVIFNHYSIKNNKAMRSNFTSQFLKSVPIV